MPGYDGTGPRGMGPMTGGGRGFCSPWGIGAAVGRGWGMPYPPRRVPYRMPYGYFGGQPAYGGAVPPVAPQVSGAEDLEFLKAQARSLRDQLARITDRIKELEG